MFSAFPILNQLILRNLVLTMVAPERIDLRSSVGIVRLLEVSTTWVFHLVQGLALIPEVYVATQGSRAYLDEAADKTLAVIQVSTVGHVESNQLRNGLDFQEFTRYFSNALIDVSHAMAVFSDPSKAMSHETAAQILTSSALTALVRMIGAPPVGHFAVPLVEELESDWAAERAQTLIHQLSAASLRLLPMFLACQARLITSLVKIVEAAAFELAAPEISVGRRRTLVALGSRLLHCLTNLHLNQDLATNKRLGRKGSKKVRFYNVMKDFVFSEKLVVSGQSASGFLECFDIDPKQSSESRAVQEFRGRIEANYHFAKILLAQGLLTKNLWKQYGGSPKTQHLIIQKLLDEKAIDVREYQYLIGDDQFTPSPKKFSRTEPLS